MADEGNESEAPREGIAGPEEGGDRPDLGNDPEGSLRIKVHEGDKHVVLEFGREVEKLVLTPEQAVGIATVLVMHAKQVSAKRLIVRPGGSA